MLADTIHKITIFPKSNQKVSSIGLVKLPPMFNNKESLSALLNTAFDYYSKNLTLKSLPGIFNKYAKKEVLLPNDIRKVHNWINQVAFCTRAACIYDNLDNTSNEVLEIMNKYNIPYILKENNEYKPIKYASSTIVKKWIDNEFNQIKNKENFGYNLSKSEKELYGIYQNDNNNTIKSIYSMIKNAKNFDLDGNYKQAEYCDTVLFQLFQDAKEVI